VIVLQRPFRFEVALVSRVSSFRAHGLKASAEAFTQHDHRGALAGFLVPPKTHCLRHHSRPKSAILIPQSRSALGCRRRGPRLFQLRPRTLLVDSWVRYGTADLLGVCDVKDLMRLAPEGAALGSDFSVQPRIPEAANIYCTHRANFAHPRRTLIVENSIGILISHIVFHRL